MNKVLFVAVLCGLVAVSLQDAIEDFAKLINDLKETCAKESGAKPEMIAKTFNGEYPDDKETKCYLKCMLIKLKAIKEDGTIDVEYIKKHPKPGDSEENTAAMLEKCKDSSVGADVCEKAYNIAKCFHEARTA